MNGWMTTVALVSVMASFGALAQSDELARAREELKTGRAQLDAERAKLAAERAQLEADRARFNAERAATRAASVGAQPNGTPRSMPPLPAHLADQPIFKAGMQLEAAGEGKGAVRHYILAARSGNCEAAKRLGQMFDTGAVPGVSRDYAESLKWFNFARTVGTCEVPIAKSRD